MMRCEVCGYKIPKGKKECPNCGYQLEKKYTASRETVLQKEYKPQLKTKQFNHKKNDTAHFKSNAAFLIRTFLVVLIIFIVLFTPKDISSLSFKEVVDTDRDDKYNTVEKALEYREDIIEKIYDNNLVYFEIQEQIYQENKDLTAVSYISIGHKDDNFSKYRLILVNQKGVCVQCYLDGGCEIDEFPVVELEEYSSLLGYNSILKELEVIELPLYHNYGYESDKIDLYVLESFHGNDVSFRISMNGMILDRSSIY